MKEGRVLELRGWLGLGAAALLCAAGCSEELEGLDNFDVEVADEAVVEAATPLELILGDFPVLDAFTRFDLAQSGGFQNAGYSPDDVDSVVLETLALRVKAPEGQDLSFFGALTFYVQTQGLPRKQIARCEQFPPGAAQVECDTSPDDLKDYLLSKEGTVSVEVEDTQRPPQDTTVELRAVFDVDVNLL